LWFLSIVGSDRVISASLCAPALPFIADHFSAHFSYIQFTISLFLIGKLLVNFYPVLYRQIRPKKYFTLRPVFYVLASCSCALANQMSFLLAARFSKGWEAL